MPDLQDRRHDLVIRGATIVDGTGAPRFAGDVAVAGDRIAAIGDLGGESAAREIDAAGLILSPGFIDVHTHDDNALLRDDAMRPKLTQGVTTVVTGNCGISLAPLAPKGPPVPPLDLLGDAGAFRYPDFAAYMATLDAAALPVNAVPMVGHTTLRVAAMDALDRPARDREIAAMQALVRECLEAGAAGLSTGLFYPPARDAPKEEVVALLEVLSGSGAVYTTHMRDEGDHVTESLAESFETARTAGVPLIVSHHKCSGRENFGRSRETLAMFDAARARQDVALDAYPYAASSTVLLDEYLGKAKRIMIAWSEPYPDICGRYLDEIAAAWGCAETEAFRRLKPGGAIYFVMDEEDVRRILAYKYTMIGSDGLPHDKHPHPRLWGAFARVLGHYVREVGLMPLEQAVHKMTGLSAARFALTDRGVIRAGAFADLVLFDAARIAEGGSFENPARPAAGIEMVLVNGRPVLADGTPTGEKPGRALRRAA
ncbi:MAG: D-aminoacylase [Rhodospirillales bacterium]|nr:MAG: D-aminoacylase [Rhodospirillales bacterium]